MYFFSTSFFINSITKNSTAKIVEFKREGKHIHNIIIITTDQKTFLWKNKKQNKKKNEKQKI